MRSHYALIMLMLGLAFVGASVLPRLLRRLPLSLPMIYVGVLRDTDWCQQLGMTKVPDHATLCRAFHHILTRERVGAMLDLFARVMREMKKLGQTLAIDSTLYDTHHHSRHYERRCRKQASLITISSALA